MTSRLFMHKENCSSTSLTDSLTFAHRVQRRMSNLEEIGICRQDNVIVSAWSASEINVQARQHSYRTLTSANVIIVYLYILYIHR